MGVPETYITILNVSMSLVGESLTLSGMVRTMQKARTHWMRWGYGKIGVAALWSPCVSDHLKAINFKT